MRLGTSISIATSAVWQSEFCNVVATSLNIAPDRVTIVNVVSGSVLLTTQLAPSGVNANSVISPSAAATALVQQLLSNSSVLCTNLASNPVTNVRVDTSYTPTTMVVTSSPATTIISGGDSLSVGTIVGIVIAIVVGAVFMSIMIKYFCFPKQDAPSAFELTPMTFEEPKL